VGALGEVAEDIETNHRNSKYPSVMSS